MTVNKYCYLSYRQKQPSEQQNKWRKRESTVVNASNEIVEVINVVAD